MTCRQGLFKCFTNWSQFLLQDLLENNTVTMPQVRKDGRQLGQMEYKQSNVPKQLEMVTEYPELKVLKT